MKIAIVIERYVPEAGGNERSTEQVARRLIERGHEVTILTGSAGLDDDALPGGTVLAQGRRRARTFVGVIRFICWAESQLRSGRFDVSLSVTPLVAASVLQPRGGTVRETLARNVAIRCGAGAKWLKRTLLAVTLKQQAMLLAERRTLKHARVKKIVAISRYVADQLFYHYTIPSRRIALIPNAADVMARMPAHRAELRRSVRQQFNLGADDVVFLFAAMNPTLKGIAPLMQAMQQVASRCPSARLAIAGSLDYRLGVMAADLQLTDVVRTIGPTRQMDALYAAADVTVLPTYYDPSSKVVIESLLNGTPAITTLYNGAAPWVADPTGQTDLGSPLDSTVDASAGAGGAGPPPGAGRVIRSPDDVEALAGAGLDLCDGDERARCAEATQRLDPRLHMDRHVEQLEQVLTEAANASDAGG